MEKSMEKSPPSPPLIGFEGSSPELLHCVSKLEIVTPKPLGVFLCGSIPVPTDKAFHSFNSAIVPSRQTVTAPRYRMLPTATDLNMLPLLSNFSEKVLPNWAVQSQGAGDIPWDGGAVTSNLSRKCEALALSGLVDYGDEIDVIAPTDILKQIFKMPYSKARLSIAVHRVGQTLVLNAGPGVEEGEKLVRRHKNQSKCADQSLFLNFAMHSVRMEACDCPKTHQPPSQKQSYSPVLPEKSTSKLANDVDSVGPELERCAEYTQREQDALLWKSKKSKKSTRHDPIKKTSEVGEKPRGSMKESEKHRRIGDDGFLRVLFWQFHNFRMLLGSDLLLFSNEKYVSVSLHLWDITRQVTPLNWLEAWLDNFMSSVPELAICYHENGVVQGYELLKTDDIFLLKGLSEDGTPAFHPYVIQQNGLSVLRFLQENCKQDPGAYWLYKSAGKDVIQLFDLSLIPKNQSSCNSDDGSSSLPSGLHRGKSDSLFSLGSLLFRIAHRLSVSMAPNKRAKCVSYFNKCLDFLDEPDHLFVRASAHEQFARLILSYDDELDFTLDSLPMGCGVVVTDAEEDSLDFLSSISGQGAFDDTSTLIREDQPREDYQHFQISLPEDFESGDTELGEQRSWDVCPFETQIYGTLTDPCSVENPIVDEEFAVCKVSPSTLNDQSVDDPISPKLAAIHHVSQAIKSLRLMRQLRTTEPEPSEDQVSRTYDRLFPSYNFSVCACGDTDCIEVCDLRSWLPTTNLDHKLWKLVLLLGESYLALGQAYKEDGQLHQALKVVELACSVYGSMPQHLDDTKFISSFISYSTGETKLNGDERIRPYKDNYNDFSSGYDDDFSTSEEYSSTYLFWANAWTLVGDVYVELHLINDKQISKEAEGKSSIRDLRMSSEVVKEVNRLKKKLGKSKQNCSSCSLVNCSCRSDRANSGSSAGCSSGNRTVTAYNRKYSKISHSKSSPKTHLEDFGDDYVCPENEKRKGSIRVNLQKSSDTQIPEEALSTGNLGIKSFAATSDEIGQASSWNHEMGSINGEAPKSKNGGIFKYLGGSGVESVESSLVAAMKCYQEAKQALGELPANSIELQSVTRKRGWVCNELGRRRLERKELNEAEDAFSDAVDAFREVSDHTNIILIGCNLGHGRRSLAEEMISKIEDLRKYTLFQNAYSQALEKAKLEYSKSLRYYGAAKSYLNTVGEDTSIVSSGLKNEVYTQLAHTYLRLGMLLAREDTTANVYDHGALDDKYAVYSTSSVRKERKEPRKHEVSANDAIREALSLYESLGELRKQEAAYAYFQLACYQRDCCLKFLDSDYKKSTICRGVDGLQRARQYASLAERNWQKAMEFYNSKTHPTMYLTVLIERSALSFSLSSSLHSNGMLEEAFAIMLEGRHLPESLEKEHSQIHSKFWTHLQMVLKKMVSISLSANASRPSSVTPPSNTVCNRSGEAEKLKKLYKMSLTSCQIRQLHSMHELWIS